MQRKTILGFTLIELLIGIAIFGVISAIAYPMYTQHLRKGKRTEALFNLQNIILQAEQYALQNNNNYPSDLTVIYTTPPTSPYYDFSICDCNSTTTCRTVGATPNCVQARATGKGEQAKDTKCVKIMLNSTGEKRFYGQGGANNTILCSS